MIHPATPHNLTRAAQILREGGILAFPTETVYGLAADAFNPEAVHKIFTLKGRPSFNPLIVHIYSMDQLHEVVNQNLPPSASAYLTKLSRHWPGPLSVVLPKTPRIPPCVTAGLDTVAVRVPAHPIARALLKECGFPVAAPSANISNRVSPTTAEHVMEEFGAQLDFILDGGPCQVGLESTVISLVEDPPRLLRPGAVTLEELSIDLGLIETTPPKPEAGLASPGLLQRHYAPRTKVVMREDAPTHTYPTKTGFICFNRNQVHKESSKYSAISVISEEGNLKEVAQRLFACLREMDKLELDLIVVDSCPIQGLGAAIMDRLQRACKKE